MHVFLHTLILLLMLKRSPTLGQLILMIQEMLTELQRFAMTMSFIVAVFVLLGRICQRIFKITPTSLTETALNVFDGFIGNQDYTNYTFPSG
mmetsp:Transcript_31436/g.48064  ORF Transcript_31436/g.48064 Transcript_31436/m.48064 type:complete len:92 (+) Transcript_31436:2754-3029(+)